MNNIQDADLHYFLRECRIPVIVEAVPSTCLMRLTGSSEKTNLPRTCKYGRYCHRQISNWTRIDWGLFITNTHHPCSRPGSLPALNSTTGAVGGTRGGHSPRIQFTRHLDGVAPRIHVTEFMPARRWMGRTYGESMGFVKRFLRETFVPVCRCSLLSSRNTNIDLNDYFQWQLSCG